MKSPLLVKYIYAGAVNRGINLIVTDRTENNQIMIYLISEVNLLSLLLP
jgi:hypothetical protein